MAPRFVRPDTVTLTISQGDTLTVRRRLNAGEQREMFARMYHAGVNGALRVNPLAADLATVCAYLLDWSLKDDSGRDVVIRDVSQADLSVILDSLEPDCFAEISHAIDAHAERMQAERTAEKNGQDGAKASPAISPSPSDAAGVLSGFESSTSTTTPF